MKHCKKSLYKPKNCMNGVIAFVRPKLFIFVRYFWAQTSFTWVRREGQSLKSEVCVLMRGFRCLSQTHSSDRILLDSPEETCQYLSTVCWTLDSGFAVEDGVINWLLLSRSVKKPWFSAPHLFGKSVSLCECRQSGQLMCAQFSSACSVCTYWICRKQLCSSCGGVFKL